MIRSTEKPFNHVVDRPVKKINFEGETLIDFLMKELSVLMSQSDDPNIIDKKPDGYVNSLMSGKLGDITKRIILAIFEQEHIGIVIGITGEEGFHITTLGTHPNYRRQGIGVSLMEALRKELLIRGVKDMYLDVHLDNQPAVKLYEKLGFRLKYKIPEN